MKPKIQRKPMDISFHKSKSHALSYTGSARQKLRENPEILREFLKMVANKGFPEIKTDKFQIRRLSITKSREDASYNTSLYSLEFFRNGKTERYFIKELDIQDFFRLQRSENLRYDVDIIDKINRHGIRGFGGSDGFSESLALKIIADSGVVGRRLDIVNSVFSYVDAINKKSFICYEYMDLKTVSELYDEHKISKSQKETIDRYLSKVATRVENYLEKNYSKYGFKTAPKIFDISPQNTFYDPVKKKLHLFDSLLIT